MKIVRRKEIYQNKLQSRLFGPTTSLFTKILDTPVIITELAQKGKPFVIKFKCRKCQIECLDTIFKFSSLFFINWQKVYQRKIQGGSQKPIHRKRQSPQVEEQFWDSFFAILNPSQTMIFKFNLLIRNQ